MSDKHGNKPDAWLSDESTVSRAYGELKKPEPPAHLDEQILAQARRAAATRDKTVIRVERWRTWVMPAALAATVVFAVPLVVRIFDTGAPGNDAAYRYDFPRTDTVSPEIELVESDRSLAELTSPEAVAPSAIELGRNALATAPPQAPAEVAARSMEPLDLEIVAAEEQLRQSVETDAAAIVSDMPSLDTGAAATIPALPAADDGNQVLARRETYAAAPPHADAEPRSGSARDSGEHGFADAAESASAPPESAALLQIEKTAASASERYRPNAERLASRNASLTAADGSESAVNAMAAADGMQQDSGVEEGLVSPGMSVEPETWLIDIADQYRRGWLLEARRELGSFLTAYPDYELPDDYPLQAEDAIFDGGNTDDAEIVPEAASWLRGIGLMAQRGQTDQARTQLAKFFTIYPDYPLPADFPLTREDALPIER